MEPSNRIHSNGVDSNGVHSNGVHSNGNCGNNHTTNYVAAKSLPLCLSYRLLIGFCCMLGCVVCFASQASMSSALVCMIQHNNTTTTQQLKAGTENSSMTQKEPDDSPWRFSWSTYIQGWIVSVFFMSYYIIQIPAGVLVDRLGPKRILIGALLITAVSHILTVPATRWSLPSLFVFRIVAGAGTGSLWPSTFGVIGNWAPRKESSFLFGLTGLGIEVGNSVAFGTSLFACETNFQGGWSLVFYVTAGFQLLLAFFMWCVVTDHPSDNPYISKEEAFYISKAINAGYKTRSIQTTPICNILQSPPVHAVSLSQTGTLMMYYTVVTQGPIYLRDVIRLSNSQINLLSSIPFLIVIPLVFVLGLLADWLIQQGYLSTTTVRKLMDGFCKCFGILLMVFLGFVPIHGFTPAFCLYTMAAFSMSFAYVSYIPNAGDLSPLHTGFITSVQQASSLWVSFVIPPIVSTVTEGKTRSSWQYIFFMEVAVQLFTLIIFSVFGSGELQPWAFDKDDVVCPIKSLTEDNLEENTNSKEKYGSLTTTQRK